MGNVHPIGGQVVYMILAKVKRRFLMSVNHKYVCVGWGGGDGEVPLLIIILQMMFTMVVIY